MWFGVLLRTFRLEEPGIEPPVFWLVDIVQYDIEPLSVVWIQETDALSNFKIRIQTFLFDEAYS